MLRIVTELLMKCEEPEAMYSEESKSVNTDRSNIIRLQINGVEEILVMRQCGKYYV